MVTEDIQKYARLAHREKTSLVQSVWYRLNYENSDSEKVLLTRKKKLQSQIDTNQAATKTLFEDRAKGYVPDNIFHTQINHFSEELESLKRRLQDIQLHARQKHNGLMV